MAMRTAKKCFYRKYKIGETIRVSEKEYTCGNDPLNRAKRVLNTYKVVQDYPLFVVCERQPRSKMLQEHATMRTTFLKWDLERQAVQKK